MNGNDGAQQSIQEAEYAYPYHYIPTWDGQRFSQQLSWSWGYRYLGGILLVIDQLRGIEFQSLVDIGCGDGRFLREAARSFPKTGLLGLDYSARAIALARAMNPGLQYRAVNILEESLTSQFDVATLIEVLEHIPTQDVPAFLAAVAATIKPGGWLILTVPHRNKPVESKHFQHFDTKLLASLVAPHFHEFHAIPFDALPRVSNLLNIFEKLLGGRGRYFLVTNRRLWKLFFRFYLKHYLYSSDESSCGRIAMICRKK